MLECGYLSTQRRKKGEEALGWNVGFEALEVLFSFVQP